MIVDHVHVKPFLAGRERRGAGTTSNMESGCTTRREFNGFYVCVVASFALGGMVIFLGELWLDGACSVV